MNHYVSAPRYLRVISIFWVVAGAVASGQDQELPLKTTAQMGPVSVEVSLSPSRPVIGDSLELVIQVVSEKGVEVLMPEFGEALGRFQISDFLPREKRGDRGQTVHTQKYRLQSPPSGQHAIPPVLIEFVDRRQGEKESPDGLDAYELFTERINFAVESVIVKNASDELNPPLGKLKDLDLKLAYSVSIWIYVVLALGGIVTLGLMIWSVVLFRRRVVRKSAYEIARAQLDQLIKQKELPNADIDLFYVRLSNVVRQYLENRFDLRAPELTTEEFLTTVSGSAELTVDHKKLLNDFLKHADLVKFAGLQPDPSDIDESVSKASRFLEDTRENSPLIVENTTQSSTPRKELSGTGSSGMEERTG